MSGIEIWLLGSVAATVCCSLDYELRDKTFDADSIWACVLFSWVIVAAYAGYVIAKRMKRAAQAGSVHEHAVGNADAPKGKSS